MDFCLFNSAFVLAARPRYSFLEWSIKIIKAKRPQSKQRVISKYYKDIQITLVQALFVSLFIWCIQCGQWVGHHRRSYAGNYETTNSPNNTIHPFPSHIPYSSAEIGLSLPPSLSHIPQDHFFPKELCLDCGRKDVSPATLSTHICEDIAGSNSREWNCSVLKQFFL